MIYFNPNNPACKNVVGGICVNNRLQLNIFNVNAQQTDFDKTPFTVKKDLCSSATQKAYLYIGKDREERISYEMENTSYGWTISLKINQPGLYFYSFHLQDLGYLQCGYCQNGEFLTPFQHEFLLTVYTKDYQTPDWLKGGTMYQIFPDRFCKRGSMSDIKGRVQRNDWGGLPTYKPNEKGKVLNNDFFGGNAKGIISKLKYLKSLGVNVIYLNPIFQAASNHRYDTSDYMKIDPYFGTKEEFDTLVERAQKHGIKVILDGVFNHTGDDSVYFNKYGNYPSVGAYQSKDSPYYSWYSFQEFPNKYSSWWGIDILPEVNEHSEEYQNFIFGKGGVLKKWLGFGIGGYRLDVADELPDFFLKKLRKSVKEEDENAIIIGEVWEDASNKIAYSERREYLQGYELDSVMNYPLKDSIIHYIQTGNATDLLHNIRVLINHYPKQTVDCLMNILGTHDTARILTVLGGIYCHNKDQMASPQAYMSENAKKNAIEKLKMAAVLQYTLPGVPCLYYGDENGMEGHIDPFCRRCFDWEHLNEDLIGFYSKLGEIREKYRDIFNDGDFIDLECQNGLIFYKRTKNNQSVYVFANNSSKTHLLKLSEKYVDCLTNENYEDFLEIKPYSYKIFVNN